MRKSLVFLYAFGFAVIASMFFNALRAYHIAERLSGVRLRRCARTPICVHTRPDQSARQRLRFRGFSGDRQGYLAGERRINEHPRRRSERAAAQHGVSTSATMFL